MPVSVTLRESVGDCEWERSSLRLPLTPKSLADLLNLPQWHRSLRQGPISTGQDWCASPVDDGVPGSWAASCRPSNGRGWGGEALLEKADPLRGSLRRGSVALPQGRSSVHHEEGTVKLPGQGARGRACSRSATT